MNQEIKNYYVGFEVKDTKCNEYMSIAWLGNKITPKDCVIEILKYVSELSKFKTPTTVKIIGEAKSVSDVPVWSIEICDKQKEILLTQMWRKVNQEQEHTKGLIMPNWYITKSSNWEKDQEIVLNRIFINEVGNTNSIYSFNV